MKSYPTVIDRKIRIAIVGCGRISKNHFGSIEKHQDNIELVSICDVQQAVLSEHEATYKVKGYLDLSDMLENEELDLVAICTPSGVHADQTELCARHGVNVMTEKPMATRWSDGIRMVKACDDAGVRLFVVKQNSCSSFINKSAFDGGRKRIIIPNIVSDSTFKQHEIIKNKNGIEGQLPLVTRLINKQERHILIRFLFNRIPSNIFVIELNNGFFGPRMIRYRCFGPYICFCLRMMRPTLIFL